MASKHGSIQGTTCDAYGGVKSTKFQVIKSYHYFHYKQ